MRFSISHHAEFQMLRRQIPRAWLDALLQAPEQRVPQPDGTEILQSRFASEDGRMYLLRAVIDPGFDPPVLVTVYQTSKIAKYWRP